MISAELNAWLTQHIDTEAKAVVQAERANAPATAAIHQYGRSLLLDLRVAIDAADELGGHTLFVCDGQHDDYGRSCMFCDGGLSACATCGAFEGAWTTHCPHVKVDGDTWDKVYAGELDYRNGRWVSEASPHCPSGFRKAMREAAK